MSSIDNLLKQVRALQAGISSSVLDEMYAGAKDELLRRIEARRAANRDLPPEEAQEWEDRLARKIAAKAVRLV